MNDLLLHPGLWLIFAGLLLPAIPQVVRRPLLLIIPALVFARVFLLKEGTYGVVSYNDWEMTFLRVDGLSGVFAHILALMSFVGTLYAFHQKKWGMFTAGWVYAGSALGAVYAGDFLTLFLFWELMAVSSVFLVWMRSRDQSLARGFRYLLVHSVGGVVLLAGIVLYCNAPGNDWAFDGFVTDQMTTGSWLILIGFLLNAAVPPLHAWLPDAYGEASVEGAIFLCTFTTKTAVYALCRGFAGLEILIILGVIMSLYGVVYAVLENDSRRLLGYHIISQVGYMVAGVGIGTHMAINGVCAHAFTNILYKGLLFMGCGSVLFATGKSKFTDLGGLYKKMPWTFFLTLIGGLSISAFPLTNGFISKPMIVAAGFEEHLLWVAYLLMLASVGTFLHTGLKVPYLIFFGENRCSKQTWQSAKDPGWNMMAAMVIAAFLCIFGGIYTPYLYNLLPHTVTFHPYTAYHVSEAMSVLLFTAFGFYLMRKRLETHADISLDMDWFYRKGAKGFMWFARRPVQATDNAVGKGYISAGLAPLMATARWAGSFDREVIDGGVHAIAGTVSNTARRLLGAQRGVLQEALLVIVGVLTIILIAASLWFFNQ